MHIYTLYVIQREVIQNIIQIMYGIINTIFITAVFFITLYGTFRIETPMIFSLKKKTYLTLIELRQRDSDKGIGL